MISAGNDIVALNLVDKQRTLLPAFYLKFITPAELSLHKESAISFENFIWLLWSVKESAYKYLKRSDESLVFSPSKLIVQNLSIPAESDRVYLDTDQIVDTFYDGIVSTGSSTIKFRSAINNQFIATVINEGDVYWGVQAIADSDYHTQSNAVRLLALAKLNDIILADDLWIDKHSSGYPFIVNGTHPLRSSISFAHHGCYVSYAFQLPK
ncbi:4'-phosphopantetheinyl transferase family protein [Mucilaginibacter sp. UYCu711]|uniref:4'-phosphopantetheinyl transferase family protein n=1 Tax=Mucilaginibacter sp. UYCu711 TaxID=3156339 RepID=UPI003D1AFB70